MPSSTSSSSSGDPRHSAEDRRLPSALLLALLLIGAVEAGVWPHSALAPTLARYAPRGPDTDPLVTYGKLAGMGTASHDPVILLGSSQVREGLDCAIFEQVGRGRPCTNLGTAAGSPLDALDLLAQIDRDAPHRQLVLAIFPKVMHVEIKESFAGPAVALCVVEAAPPQAWRDREQLVFGLLQHSIPSLRFKDALGPTLNYVGGAWRDVWENELPPAPSRRMSDDRAQPPEYFAARIGRVDGDSPEVGPFSRIQERALEQLIRSERRGGSRLIVVDFPTRPGYISTLRPAVATHWRTLKRRLRHRSDLIFITGGDLPRLDVDQFLDFTHLNSSGREVVSRRLAEIVSDLEPRSRSVGDPVRGASH